MFKQNIKSCNARRQRQRRRTVKKTTIGLISKKATLHVQHTFFVHFFAVVLHDHNVKLPETFLWRKCRTCSRSLFFFTAAHFLPALLAASIVTAAFHVISSKQKKCLHCFFLSLFFISRSRSLSPSFSLSFAGLPLFLCLSLALYSKFKDKTINLSLIL